MTDSKGTGVLSPAQRVLLADVLDQIVPPQGEPRRGGRRPARRTT